MAVLHGRQKKGAISVGFSNVLMSSIDGVGRNFYFQIDIAGQVSPTFNRLVHFSPPSISSSNISVDGINTTGGEIVEFFGDNFGVSSTSIDVYTVQPTVGNFSSCYVNIPHVSFVCKTPEGQGSNVLVVIVIESDFGDQSSKAGHPIAYKRPTIRF